MPKSRKAKRTSQSTTKKTAPKMSRRAMLQNAGVFGAGGVAVAALGYWVVSSSRADAREQDLSVLGSGTPVIVQVHDPNCAICAGLQREARAALSGFDDSQIAYRVADITTVPGSSFATQHGSAHATLLFFDDAGQLTRRVRAPALRDDLRDMITAHLTAE